MNAPERPPSADTNTDWLVEQLRSAPAVDLVRIADAALSWLAIVDLEFRRRYPLEYVIWRSTVAADGLDAADEPAPAPHRRH